MDYCRNVALQREFSCSQSDWRCAVTSAIFKVERMSIKKSFICVAVAASAFAAQASNLVVNGSFEQVSVGNTQPTGTWNIYSSIIGWSGIPNIEVRDHVAGDAQNGSNFVELDTNNNSGMFQVINGNGWYNLSFWFSPRERVAAGSNGIGFNFGDLSGQVLTSVAGAPSGNVWQQYTGLVNLNGPTALLFYATGRFVKTALE